MRLGEILAYLGGSVQVFGDNQEQEITGITFDSRYIEPGYIFVAISGVKTDGHLYIPQALDKGASAVVVERLPEDIPAEAVFLLTSHSRRTMALIASLLNGLPDQKMRMIGVTGTNGKTTTVNLIKWLLSCAGRKTGLLGTINNQIGDEILPSIHTTPEASDFFALLGRMQRAACHSVVMEVSSHALDQGRVAGCNFDGAVFTNLTQDHLDYHGTLEEYLKSKLELFRMVKAGIKDNKYCVVNLDDPAAPAFMDACSEKLITYGMDEKATVRAADYHSTPEGSLFTLVYQGQERKVKVPLIGKFNIYNSLAALSVSLAEGLSLDESVEYLSRAPQVAGRFELVDEGQDFTVVVDYAHTPDGLINVLNSARELGPVRLICVFGCGGDRDRTKRPIMGKISGELADISIVTSDNPRSEEPLDIINQIEEGIRETGKPYILMADRREAIAEAVRIAQKGDIIVIAGKGHEDYQLIKDRVIHFDDRETAHELLRERLGR